jgi:hypothetical protein
MRKRRRGKACRREIGVEGISRLASAGCHWTPGRRAHLRRRSSVVGRVHPEDCVGTRDAPRRPKRERRVPERWVCNRRVYALLAFRRWPQIAPLSHGARVHADGSSTRGGFRPWQHRRGSAWRIPAAAIGRNNLVLLDSSVVKAVRIRKGEKRAGDFWIFRRRFDWNSRNRKTP